MVQLLIQMILIALNAFFASSEIAVLSLNPMQLEKKASQGDKTAQTLLKLINEPSGFLSTIQVGITLAGFLGSAFAADYFSEYFVQWIYDDLSFHVLTIASLDMIAVIIITIILSYFTLVFGELVPKRIAMQKPYEVASKTCRVISLIFHVAKPIVRFLSWSTNTLLKMLHFRVDYQDEDVSEEEILIMVELGLKKGVVDQDEKQWIENVFEFDNTIVKDVMTRKNDMVVLDAKMSQQEIIDMIQTYGLSRYPVYQGDKDQIIGILRAKDYLLKILEGQDADIKDVMILPYFIADTMKADALFSDMQSHKIHMAIAIDEYGQVSGIVTMEDLIEEIVGNIYDEYEHVDESVIESLDDKTWQVSGECLVEEFMEMTGQTLIFDHDYETMNGLVFSRLHTIPQDGSSFQITIEPFIFDIINIKDRMIETMIVKLIEKSDG